ncbi:Hypothetical protein BRZCDTV_442 [Brazilian cedratvirus IHUMI]|uniref:Uncharacterized protein n=1 Tax=Brazilian cedratvirus IHUMI TaxID=2126980 RepID=A0A2R8FF91_9VIRU|nr:Hypothetical protein BRZCDTV_442 [Brazilian cedratvirus IHUMI]
MNKCHPCLNKVPILHYGYTMDLYEMRDYLYNCPDFALKCPELLEDECVRKSFSLLEYLKTRFTFLPGTRLYYFVSKPYKGEIYFEDDVVLFLGYKLETDDDIKRFRFWEGGLPFPQSDIDLKRIITDRPDFYVGFSA